MNPTPNPSEEGIQCRRALAEFPSWEGRGVGRFMESFHGFATAHLDPEPGRDGALRRPRRAQRRNDAARCFAGGDIAARCPYQSQVHGKPPLSLRACIDTMNRIGNPPQPPFRLRQGYGWTSRAPSPPLGDVSWGHETGPAEWDRLPACQSRTGRMPVPLSEVHGKPPRFCHRALGP